jgi:hypothetical protein
MAIEFLVRRAFESRAGYEGWKVPDYPVSVVVPTRVGWPEMRISTDALLPQLRAVGAQLVIADASDAPVPTWSKSPDVKWLRLPGAPGTTLRQAGYAAAEAPIIAITEDHAAPSPEWLASVLEEHAAHPDAAVVYGMVANGSHDHLVDWALYGVGYLAWAPPAPTPSGNPGHANLSFKRWAFDQVRPDGETLLEFRYIDALRKAGERIVASDRLLVTHYQCAGIRRTSELFFHNGRAIAGIRRERMTGLDWLRAGAPLLMAGFRTARTLRTARSKPNIEPIIMRSLPLIVLLHALHAMGETVGYLGGPSDSPTHLH